MNPILIIGTVIVTGALVFYSLAVITEQRKKILSSIVMKCLSLGIVLDITATAFMIAGSRNLPFTLHGLLGYSALLAMMIDTILTWRLWKSPNMRQPVPRGYHLYTRIAYIWWVVAYIAGGLIASIGLH